MASQFQKPQPKVTKHKIKGNLRKHIEAEHEKKRNHVCRECGYAASQKVSLMRHIEGVHKKVRNHGELEESQ